VHNSISIDGSLVDFEVNLPLHYQLAGGFHADIHLVGSNTAITGIDTFLREVPPETAADFRKPRKEGILWAIPDTTGKLHGLLHIFRQSEYCRDVIVLVSERTSNEYLQYLREREYDHHLVGIDKCNLQRTLELLNETYHAHTVLTDTGRILSNLLLERGLVSDISLLIHPVIVGDTAYKLFDTTTAKLNVELVRYETFEDAYVWTVYCVTSAITRNRKRSWSSV
jgi:2,5-diamino-6-(ribosylamino)-4(3H)-pyrimidinone 5'-phosphate reductase